jgi:hypothetical protein
MELFVELETLKLVTSQTDRREMQSVTVKRGDALPLTVRFLQNQTPTRLDSTTVISFALKESGKYDATPVVLEQTFTASSVGSPDSDPHYTATPSLNTTELNAIFLIDGNSANDPVSAALMGELTWTATGDTGPTTIKTFSATCENDVYRGTESAPSSQQSPDEWIETRGILPIRSGSTHLFPASLNLSGVLLNHSSVQADFEVLTYSSTSGLGYPLYTSTDFALTHDGMAWDLVYSGDTPSITTTFESGVTDPTDLVLVNASSDSVTIKDASGKTAPKLGSFGYLTGSTTLQFYNGQDWVNV